MSSEPLAPVTTFLGATPLTQAIKDLEYALENVQGDVVADKLAEHNVSFELLAAAFYAREQFGRINDLIHAAAIALALPKLLEAGEIMERPSLAAGNDPRRPYDLASDRRIAEFKLGRWDGNDAGRKRSVFKDLVNLAAARDDPDNPDDRRPELYVRGPRPHHFLSTTKATAAWALNRQAKKTQQRFVKRFGSLDMPVKTFYRDHAAHVTIIDLERERPDLFNNARLP